MFFLRKSGYQFRCPFIKNIQMFQINPLLFKGNGQGKTCKTMWRSKNLGQAWQEFCCVWLQLVCHECLGQSGIWTSLNRQLCPRSHIKLHFVNLNNKLLTHPNFTQFFAGVIKQQHIQGKKHKEINVKIYISKYLSFP